MIKNTELRIGNLVKMGESIVKIKSIDENGLNAWPQIDYDTIDMNYDTGTAEGIPLTEEILGQCGFHGQAGVLFTLPRNEGISIHAIGPLEGLGNVFRFEFFGTALCLINSLHQLQNICFSLRGKELEMKMLNETHH